MATWNEIFDKMPKGGTAVQEALEAVNYDAEHGGEFIQKSVSVNTANIVGTVIFTRSGRKCTASGYLSKITPPYNGAFIPTAQIPAGFGLAYQQPTGSIVASMSTNDLIAWVTLVNNGLSLKTTNDFMAKKVDGQGTFTVDYFTEDDFPS